jgi:hypothetical protein
MLVQRRNRNSTYHQPLIILAFSFFFYNPLYSQVPVRQDPSIKGVRKVFSQFADIRKILRRDSLFNLSPHVTAELWKQGDRNIIFYDSLRSKASKNTITKALYDLIVVTPDTLRKKKTTRSSQENFREFSGKKIRNIHVQTLNVFGTDISNPDYNNPSATEKLLNKSHFNTNENILRKYLIFSEGDTLSSLKLSDNERLIRQLPFIEDARIIVTPAPGDEVDVLIVTKDVYSLGISPNLKSRNRGNPVLYDKNIFGIGHEFDISVPYAVGKYESPGLGLNYNIYNLWKSFINLNLNYSHALGTRKYGIGLSKELLSSTTKYAGGITINQTFTSVDLDTMPKQQPLQFNYQDYWIMRSFLLDKESVTRLIAGLRYKNNNVYQRPLINPNSYQQLQRYMFFVGSLSLSLQKYYKTTLLYSYGRTEDVPYGMMLRVSAGTELNEFKRRTYSGIDFSFGQSLEKAGYFYGSSGLGTYFNGNKTEQGVLLLRMKYFSNLIYIGRYRFRNFVNIDYTRGFDRYIDDFITIPKVNGFTGLSNDSLRGSQRIVLSLESVVFSPRNYLGFRFAVFGFGDFAYITGTKEATFNGGYLSGIGIGLRIRNDNLVFNTFQIRIGFFPNPPPYSRINDIIVSGEQMLRPANFDPGPPDVIPYR